MTNAYHTNRLNLLFGLKNNTKDIESELIHETDFFGVRTWDNVVVTSKRSTVSPKAVDIPGTSFLIQCHQQYYHFLIDSIGTYLYLKKKYPEIKPLVLFQTDKHMDAFVFNDILDYFDINNRYITDPFHLNTDSYNTFNLEKVMYLYSNPYKLFQSKDIILNLREALHDEKEIDINKKIYISRRDSPRAAIQNEEAIEEYFKIIGFTPVILSGMTVLQQKELFENASVVVGRSGTSFTNMFFINKNTKIIDISTDTEFSNYDFRSIAKILELDYTNIIIENFTDGNHLLQKLKEFATIIQ
jgi:capsular polysaccharide biosynthesis protein